MIRIFLLNLVLFISLYSANVGSITGRVVDQQTQEPLIGVNIQVLNTILGSITDEKGFYVIDDIPLGIYRLEFSYIGYTSQLITDVVVKKSKPAIIDIQLKQTSIEAEGVTVIADYFIEEKLIQPSTIGLSREEM